MAEAALSLGTATSGAGGTGGPRSFDQRILGGTYRVLGPLDGGSMGTVFEATHVRLHRNVAVKVLSREHVSRPELLERFRQEADIMSQLEHPHIVNVVDFDVTEDGQPYLVLELLHGETLQQRMDREASLSLEDIVRVTTQIASALSAAHRASIVHRDLKPSNVFLTEAPGESVFVKLLDFGISKSLRSDRKITQAQMLVGTPEYMAPEQALGRNDLVDARTDQYALAVVVYEMLTGERPFADSNLRRILERVLEHEPAPPSSIAWVPVEVDAVLARALSKRPEHRFADVMEFARELARAARMENGAAPTAAPTLAPQSGVRTNDRARAESGWDAVVPKIGSPEGRLILTGAGRVDTMPPSPHAAFLLSRIEDGMTVTELLDVASMPPPEALEWLAQLVTCGAVRVSSTPSSPSAATEGGATGRQNGSHAPRTPH